MKMGSYFKKAIFDEHVQEGLVGWAEKVKKRKGLRIGNGLPTSHAQNETTTKVELPKMFVQMTPAMEEGRSGTGEIASRPAT